MASDILIVDDEADIRDLVAGILDDEGFTTRTARDSDSALAEIANRRPHLVFLDIWLQGSKLDGLQLLEQVKRDHADVPVVQVLGDPQLPQRAIVIQWGGHDLVHQSPEVALTGASHVQGNVETRIINPDGVIEAQRNLGQLLPGGQPRARDLHQPVGIVEDPGPHRQVAPRVPRTGNLDLVHPDRYRYAGLSQSRYRFRTGHSDPGGDRQCRQRHRGRCRDPRCSRDRRAIRADR